MFGVDLNKNERLLDFGKKKIQRIAADYRMIPIRCERSKIDNIALYYNIVDLIAFQSI